MMCMPKREVTVAITPPPELFVEPPTWGNDSGWMRLGSWLPQRQSPRSVIVCELLAM